MATLYSQVQAQVVSTQLSEVANLNLRINHPLGANQLKDFKASAVLGLSLVQASPLRPAFLSPLQILVEAYSQHSLVPMVVAVCSVTTLHKTLALK